MKTRNSNAVGDVITLDYNIDTLRISDSSDDTSISTTNDILNSIKSRNVEQNIDTSEKSDLLRKFLKS